MLSQAAAYSMSGRTPYRRLLGGALIVAGTVAVVPFLALAGYFYRVLEYPDAQAPPTLSPLHRNVTHGLYAMSAVASLWVPAVGVGIVVLSVASVAGELWLVVAGTLALVVVAALLYVTPAVVALHARGEGVVTGYRRGDLRAVIIASPYAHAVFASAGIAGLLAALVALWVAVVWELVTSTTLRLAGFSFTPPSLHPVLDFVLVVGSVVTLGAVTFLVLVIAGRLVARGVASAGGQRLPSVTRRPIGWTSSAKVREDR
jgi:hypothetical protein